MGFLCEKGKISIEWIRIPIKLPFPLQPPILFVSGHGSEKKNSNGNGDIT